MPRNRILKDEAVLEIAAHPPPDAEHLSQIRALPNGYANSRAGKALIAAVKEAAESPPPEGMPLPERRRGREPSQAALDLLKTLLRLRATQFRVAARLVASTDDLERLAAGDETMWACCMAGGRRCSAMMRWPCATGGWRLRSKAAKRW